MEEDTTNQNIPATDNMDVYQAGPSTSQMSTGNTTQNTDRTRGAGKASGEPDNATMMLKVRSLYNHSSLEMPSRPCLASRYHSVVQNPNLVLRRRSSCDLLGASARARLSEQQLLNPNASKRERCLSGPALQHGFALEEMPPSPNNSVENSPRPQIALESLPKRRSPIPNGTVSSMTTTFETTSRSHNHVAELPSSSNSATTNHNHVVHEILDTANFNREIERLKTFEGWRVPFLSAAQMAEAGFYYTKKDDIVRCAFCGVEVGSWVEGDNPMMDHQRWSPACRFLRKLPVGNVPMSAGSGNESTTSNEGYDVCGTRQYGIMLRQTSGSEPLDNLRAIERLGIQQMRPPAYPHYATYDSRLSSYEMWPISLKLKPNVLSEAGFFYTGKGDQTICYYCGGGLKDWEESDVPWEEHAKWFNKCNFVLSIKGKEFVDLVSNKKPSQDETGILSENPESVPETESSEARNENVASTSGTTETVQTSSPASSACTMNPGTTPAPGSQDNPSVESTSPGTDSRLCKICFMEEMGILFLPCGHIVACPKCALLLTTCAVCRKPYSATVRAFLS